MYKILLGILLFTFSTNYLYAEETSYTNVTELYVATFDRAPDGYGLAYWVDTSTLSLEETANSFFDQLETKEKYPSNLTTIEFVNQVYTNLFNRKPDQEGLIYWAGELDSNSVSRSVFILAVINGAIGDDAKILQNKTKIGFTFALTHDEDINRAYKAMEGITADDSSVVSSMCTSGLGDCPLKKTGQIKSYDVEGEEVIDDSIKDDGFYQKGVAFDYKSRNNEKETVIDNVTGLEWQDNEDVVDNESYHEEAIEYCQDLKLGGYTDWKLPTINQLVTLVDRSKINPAIDIKFIYVESSNYYITYDKWGIRFSTGYIRSTSSGLVRCVRVANNQSEGN